MVITVEKLVAELKWDTNRTELAKARTDAPPPSPWVCRWTPLLAAGALPHVDVAKPAKAIGTNTVACMQSGVYWGYIGLVEVIVREVRRERDRAMKVIATGGLASLFAQGTELFHSIEDDLTIDADRRLAHALHDHPHTRLMRPTARAWRSPA